MSRDARMDPQPRDVLTRDGESRRVVGRGVAGSVIFLYTKPGMRGSLRGQKSLSCWRRWARDAEPG